MTPNQFPVTVIPGVTGSSNPTLTYLGNNSGQPSGFLSQYQDQVQGQDQGHHFAAFFQLGFYYGAGVGSSAASWYEQLEGTPGNTGDINLGQQAATLGAAVANGSIQPSQVSGWTLQNLCQH